jgi:hypothetical protein
MKKRYLVTVQDSTMDLGFLGRSRVLDEVSVMATDKDDAIRQAMEQKPGKPVIRAVPVFEYHITLRGHEDKRRRETFIIRTTEERDAIRFLDRKYPQVWRFARYNGAKESKERNAIVKIERREATS